MTSPNIFTPPGQPTIEDQLRTAYESGVERRREAGALGAPRSLGDIATGLMTDYHETQARTEASRQERLDASATSLHNLAKRIHPDTPTDQAGFIAEFDITWDDELDTPAIWPIDSESGERLLNYELNLYKKDLTGTLSLPEGLRIASLYCSNNQLTELNLNALPALQYLHCYNNQLTELNLDTVPALQTLHCYDNQLTELNLNALPELQYLYCNNNQLTELNLNAVPELQGLDCSDNQLTKLNLNALPALQDLYCYDNQLTELNLDEVPALEYLHCNNNQLTELNLNAVPALQTLYCSNNQLTPSALKYIERHTSQNSITVTT